METQPPPPRRSLRPFLLWGGALLLLGVLTWRLIDVAGPGIVIGDTVPDVAISTYDGYGWQGGELTQLSDLRGNVVLINFWASWCVPCQTEAALLEQTWRTYADQGVVVLGVAYSDLDNDALEFLTEYGISYPNAPDLQLRIADAYGTSMIPESFFINRDGTLAHFHAGPLTSEQMTAILDSILTGEPLGG